MIPIIIKDYHWSQNADWVFVSVDIKGVKSVNTDIITSAVYLKVHSSPFIFELFLSHEVDPVLAECTIDERSEKVSFRLKKVENGSSWDELENKGLTKLEKNEIRNQAVEFTQERCKQEKIEKEKQRFDRKQATVHDQIRLDTEEKARVAAIKTLESETALADFSTWRSSSEQKNDADKQERKVKEDKGKSKDNRIWSEAEEDQAPFLGASEQETMAIRPTTCISVSFTPRIFPTPSRESTHAEEQEWLKKQAEARRLSGFVDDDLRPEERNPQWLLDKGLSLMKTESYLGAISAFSLGIKLAPKLSQLWVERAGAQLALKNYGRTVDDCSQALELLTPKVKANEGERLMCYVRRGTAFRELDMLEEALGDFQEAILLKSENNEELVKIQNEIQEALEKSK